MISVLKVPLFVTHRKETGYRLRCLFLPQIDASAKRYEMALNKLRQAIVRHFSGILSHRDTLDERLWLTFAPELRFELVPLGFESGRRWVEGVFSAAHFSIGDRRYACLPVLDGIVADLGERSLDKVQRTERLVARIQSFFREKRKLQGNGFDPLRYLSAATDELGELELSMQLAQGRFPFERDTLLMAGLRGEIGDGRTEMGRVAADLNELGPEGLSNAILRDELVEEVRQSMCRSDAGAFVLVGPRGCGKTALVHGALRRYLASEPGRDVNQLHKIWHLDPMRVISGMSVVGQWQRRMQVVLQYLQSRLHDNFRIQRPDHLYCDNLVALLSVGKSSQNTLTLSDLLRPHLEKRSFTLIGEATPEAWEKVQQRDRRFADLFRVIRVEPPARADAVRIVGWRRAELEQRHECRFSSAAIAELIKLERRFAGAEVLPGSAIRVLERLAARHSSQEIGRAEVLAAYAASYHFRDRLFSRHLGLNLEEVAAQFASKLIGQAPVRSHLVDVVALIKSGLAAPGRPLASLLFIGPTGVGKSEAAKLLADALFDDSGGLVRFDMNEFVDDSALDRLIGGSRRPDGQLTSAVRQRRACVLLLDEIEKAHPGVHDLLLQVLGEGRLTDALGRTTDFSQCVIVLTSNLGAAAAGRSTGFTPSAGDAVHTYREAVERFFRPEFLNRIDQVVPFGPLGREDIAAIARLQLDRLLARDGFVRRLSFVNVTGDALDQLASIGYDASLGARALKRGIERALTGPIAQRLASGHDNQPMLLDVRLRDGQLQTEATLLEYAGHRPLPLPADNDSATAYQQLSDEAQALHDTLYAALDQEPGQAVALALRTLQVRLDPLRDVLARRCWDLAERQHAGSGIRTRIPRSSPNLSGWRYGGMAPVLTPWFAQHDVRDFFEQLHSAAQPLRGGESELLGWRLEIDLLQRRLEDLQSHGIDRVGLEIRALQGMVPVQVLPAAWADYDSLLDQLDAHELPSPQPGMRCFEGAGLADILRGEAGIHLWYLGDDRPLPLAIQVHRLPPEGDLPAPPAAPREIVRIRLEPRRAGEYRQLTDLRSGLVRKFADRLDPHDWQLLAWQGGRNPSSTD